MGSKRDEGLLAAGGIRGALSLPLACPPGRRGRLRRFAPEWTALAVYALSLLLLLFPHPIRNARLFEAAALGYALAGLALFLLPTAAAALALAGERQAGTFDALLLTPLDHARLAWARFAHVLLPWTRLILYLLPIYLVMASCGLLNERMDSQYWCDRFIWPAFSVFMPKPMVAFVVDFDATFHLFSPPESVPVTLTAWGCVLVPFRMLNDFSVLAFGCALGYWLSMRCRTGVRAVTLSYVLLLLALAVFATDLWWVHLANNVLHFGHETQAIGYCLIAPLLFLVRLWAAFKLVSRVARDLDHRMPGEALG